MDNSLREEYIDSFNSTLQMFIIKSENDENTDKERKKLIELITVLWLFFRNSLAEEYQIEIDDNTEDIEEFIEQFNLTLDNLAERVKQSPDNDNEWQGNRISNSDLAILYQLSKISVANLLLKKGNYTATKTWIAKMDSHTCEKCAALNGTTLPLDEPFLSDGDQVEIESGTWTYSYLPQYTAAAHPHDRCEITIELIDTNSDNVITMSVDAHNYKKLLYGGIEK